MDSWIRESPIRIWRVERDLTLEQVAKMLGITAGTVSRWETGENKAPIAALVLFAAFAGVRKETMFSRYFSWLDRKPKPVEQKG